MDDAELLAAPPRGGRAARYVAVAVGMVLAVLVVVLVTAKRTDYDPLLGKPAPALEGKTLDGTTFDLDAYRGRWVVVNFFATWCVPCQQEHPELDSFARRHAQARDAALVSVVFQDDPGKVRDYFRANGGDWPVVVGDEGRIALDYSVTGVPESILVDPAGIARARIRGGVTGLALDKELNDLTVALFGSEASRPGS